jgi:hypothetical protein
MNKLMSVVLMAVLTVVSLMTFSVNSYADEIKMVGTISKIEVAADKKSAAVVLKDSKSDKEVTIIITDDLTLDKFGDKRIVEGDEIRTKFDSVDGKNVSKMFKKTAGC